jgi:hypothetical protein
MAGLGPQVVERAVTRLKFPQAFAVFLALFLFDLVFPDLVPFVDEILLGLGTALLGFWRERPAPIAEAPKPPIKDVTPRPE